MRWVRRRVRERRLILDIGSGISKLDYRLKPAQYGASDMADYLLIESRDPFEFRNIVFCPDLAQRLDTGNHVTIFLVQNGVLPARAGAYSPILSQLAQAGAEIFADNFSLCQRGISSERCSPASNYARSISSSTGWPRVRR